MLETFSSTFRPSPLPLLSCFVIPSSFRRQHPFHLLPPLLFRSLRSVGPGSLRQHSQLHHVDSEPGVALTSTSITHCRRSARSDEAVARTKREGTGDTGFPMGTAKTEMQFTQGVETQVKKGVQRVCGIGRGRGSNRAGEGELEKTEFSSMSCGRGAYAYADTACVVCPGIAVKRVTFGTTLTVSPYSWVRKFGSGSMLAPTMLHHQVRKIGIDITLPSKVSYVRYSDHPFYAHIAERFSYRTAQISSLSQTHVCDMIRFESS